MVAPFSPKAVLTGNFLRWLAWPASVKDWTLTTLRDNLTEIGAKAVHHARYVTFQLAEVAVPRWLRRAIRLEKATWARRSRLSTAIPPLPQRDRTKPG